MIQCYSYSQFSEGNPGISFEELKKTYGDDGVAICNFNTGLYIILYNERKGTKIRFTIAHELGHILMSHHYECKIPVIKRSTLDKEQYNEFEKEAGCFARNLLCPAYQSKKLLDDHGFTSTYNKTFKRYDWKVTKNTLVNHNLRKNISAEFLIKEAFNVTDHAAELRTTQFLITDLKHIKQDNINWQSTQHIRITSKWRCTKCGSERMNNAKYCISCGNKDPFTYSGDQKKIIRKFEEDGYRLTHCPACGNASISKKALYCNICGLPLFNTCTNDESTHLNHIQARYCAFCGKDTKLKNSIHHHNIAKMLKHYPEGDTTVIYEENIKYDPKTNRITECPRCHNTEFSPDGNYCKICGLEVQNTCISEAIGYNQWTQEEEYSETHINPPNARFCEQCGRPTVYFQKRNILRPYEEVLKEKEIFDDVFPQFEENN